MGRQWREAEKPDDSAKHCCGDEMSRTDDADSSEQTLISNRQLATAETQRIGHYLVIAEAGTLQRVRIGAGGITVGRHPECDISRPLPDISRRHCRIELDGDWAVLRDLGSTNGTILDGKRITGQVQLRNSSLILAGSLRLRYECRDELEIQEEARMAGELRRALDYVRAILPAPITAGNLLAEWWFAPSATLGGDVFGYQFLDGGIMAGFLLDVSGHGIDSAMHAVNVANVLRKRSLPFVDFRDPAAVVAGLNALFPMEEHSGLMLTMWYFVYDMATRRLGFCSAGHHAAFLVAPRSTEPKSLWVRGRAIGMMPGGKWTQDTIVVEPGSRLYIFSDGAFEITTADGSSWNLDTLRKVVGNSETATEAEAQRLYQTVRSAARPGPLEDDFSVLVLHFT